MRSEPALALLASGMLCLGWLVPNHYAPWTSFYNEAGAVLCLVFLMAAQGRRGLREPLPCVAWVLFALAALPVVQWATGLLRFSGDAWISSLYFLMLAAAVGVGYAAGRADARRLMLLLAGAALVGAFVSTILACFQAVESTALGIWSNALSGNRIGANLGQPNNLATLVAWGVVGVILLRHERKLTPLAAGSLLVFLLVGSALTQSRGALLLGPIVFVGLVVARRRGVAVGVGLPTVAAFILLHWVLVFAWPALQEHLLLASDPIAERGLSSSRMQMWPMLLRAVTLVPWTGYGWLQVGAAQFAIANEAPPAGELWLHAHDLFLDLVIWCGFPLGIALSGLVVWWYASRALSVRTVESVVAMLALSIAGLHALLELPHHYLYFLIPAGLWIGCIEAQRSPWRPVGARFNALLFGLPLALAVAIAADYPALEEDFRLVRFENLRIGSVRAPQPAPDAPMLSSLTAFLAFSRSTPTAGMAPERLAQMQAITERYPYAPSISRLATALALNGRLDEAVATFTKIRQMHGRATYLRLKRNLHEQVATQPELGELYRRLPE